MSKATQVAEKFIGYLGELDIEGVSSLFAEGIVQKVPFAPEGTPKVIEGREAVTQNFAGLPMVFQSMKYSDVEVIEGADENVAVAFAHADAVLPNGSPYAQDYVFYFGLDAEGKIAAYREYMNTELQSKAFAALAAAM